MGGGEGGGGGGRKKDSPAQAGPEPADGQRPPARRVPAHPFPPQHQRRRKGLPGRQGGEEDEAGGAEVVEQLQGDDLRQDAERGGEGVRGGAGHFWCGWVGGCLRVVFFGFGFRVVEVGNWGARLSWWHCFLFLSVWSVCLLLLLLSVVVLWAGGGEGCDYTVFRSWRAEELPFRNERGRTRRGWRRVLRKKGVSPKIVADVFVRGGDGKMFAGFFFD